jgi:hypothetical protein
MTTLIPYRATLHTKSVTVYATDLNHAKQLIKQQFPKEELLTMLPVELKAYHLFEIDHTRDGAESIIYSSDDFNSLWSIMELLTIYVDSTKYSFDIGKDVNSNNESNQS